MKELSFHYGEYGMEAGKAGTAQSVVVAGTNGTTSYISVEQRTTQNQMWTGAIFKACPCDTPHPPRSLLPSSPKFPPSLNTAPPLGTYVWHQIIHRDPRGRGIAQWRYNRYHQDPKCLDPFLETTCEAGFYDIAIPEQSWPKFLQYGVMGDGFQVSHMPDNPKREHMEISRVVHDEQEGKSG